MKIEPKLVTRQNEVANRLKQLGVTRESMLEVVAAAVAGRKDCTHNDPRSAPGWKSWCNGNRRMREALFELDLGWQWNEEENIPAAINLKLKLKITMCNTDFGTGLIHYHPEQMSKKGTATDRIVVQNQDFFDKLGNTKTPVPANTPMGIACWYLCVFSDDDDVRAELSCPVRCEDGFFKNFHERIILIGQDDDGSGVKVTKQQPGGGDSDLDIPVKRKQAL